MVQEYTPELNDAVMQALAKRIREKQEQDIAAVQGAAGRRRLVGGSFEGRGTGAAIAAGTQSLADTQLQMALENAARIREERLLGEERTFRSAEAEKGRLFGAGESEKQRLFADKQRIEIERDEREMFSLQSQFQALENEKQRAVAVGENEKARLFESQQAELDRKYKDAQARKQARAELMGAGMQTAGLLGMGALSKGGGLFGGKAAGGAAGGAAAGGGAWSGNSAAMGGFGGVVPASIGIIGGTLGGAYTGQKAAGWTGKVTRESKAGAGIGAGAGSTLGTFLGGPLGGIAGGQFGGLVGGLGTKMYQGMAKQTGLNKLTNKVKLKKIF